MIRKFLFWYFTRNPKLMVEIYATIKTEIKRPFVISATQISSKKGKLKKTLLLIETKAGNPDFRQSAPRVIDRIRGSFINRNGSNWVFCKGK